MTESSINAATSKASSETVLPLCGKTLKVADILFSLGGFVGTLRPLGARRSHSKCNQDQQSLPHTAKPTTAHGTAEPGAV